MTNCIADEIINNAISACSQDYRFKPVSIEELPEPTYSVDILSPTQKINLPTELDPKRYGLVVTDGNKRGLLLPNLEEVDNVKEQISIAMRKAGSIDPKPIPSKDLEFCAINKSKNYILRK